MTVYMMRLQHCILICFITVICTGKLYAQQEPIDSKKNEQVEEQINQNVELISEQLQLEEGDLSNLTEVWRYYKSHPINLNRATKEELQELQLLTDIHINNFLKHREKNGDLISIYELQSIDGFEMEIIQNIIPFVYVSNQFNSPCFSLKEMMKYGKHEAVFRLQRILEHQAGYLVPDSATRMKKPNSYYLGDPNRLFARYRFQYNNYISAAFSGEKDAGEAFFNGTQKQGFDFYSGHLAIKNIKYIKTLVIGDYQASFGQGLSLWQGFAFGKSSAPINIKRYGVGIKPYYSFDENRFFRGIAGTVRLKKFELTGLVSYKKIDANATLMDTSRQGNTNVVEISSLQTSGLHNTNALIQDKGSISQAVFGGNATYHTRNGHIGVTTQQMSLSAELVKAPSLYNQYSFQGKHNVVSGIDYHYVIRNVNWFGEASVSKNGGKAFLQGVMVALDQRLTFLAHYRNYGRNFQNLYGNAFSENALPQNEKGIYIGMEAKLFKCITFSAYSDQYQFSWLQSNASSPSIGRDLFAQLHYTPSKKVDMYVRCRHRIKYTNTDIDNAYDYIVPREQFNYRYNVSAEVLPSLTFRSRIEYTHIAPSSLPSENGMALIQDLVYKKLGKAYAITLRYAIFDTKSYGSRVYAYESDVLYSYSVPALYGKGQRVYVLLNWDITQRIEVWLRLASTIYDNQTVIQPGSLNQINANHKTELKAQLRLKF